MLELVIFPKLFELLEYLKDPVQVEIEVDIL